MKRALTPFEAMKAEKITVTLTLGEIDALFALGQAKLEEDCGFAGEAELESALGKLDEAVNV